MSARQLHADSAAAPFTVAHAAADHWGLAAKACLEGIAEAAHGANLGILYATEGFNQHLSSILTFLRETTRIQHWVGAVVPGLCAQEAEYRGGGGALAVMVGHLFETDFRCFSGLDVTSFRIRVGDFLAGHGPCVGVVHGDPRHPGLMALISQVAEDAGYLSGGLISASGPPAQLAEAVVSGGLSGLLLGADIPVVTGLTQGCSPLGSIHTVTAANDGVLMELDGRLALDVLKHEAGELIARDLRRAAGYIHVALPVEGLNGADYLVRSLLGVDPRQGWLALGEKVEVGQSLMFVRRDPNAARADMQRMLADVQARLAGRPVRAAFYTSCMARGRHMFGENGVETGMIRDALGDIPLIGFFANGEIAGERVHGYTGVLTVLVGAASDGLP